MMNLQYVTDAKGKQRAVLIPIKDWKEYEKKNERLRKKMEVLDGLKQAMKEVKAIESGKLKAKTLKQLIDEL